MERFKILDGKLCATIMQQEMKEFLERNRNTGFTPALAVLLVGDSPASLSYVRGKAAAAQRIGLESRLIQLPAEISFPEFLQRLERVQADPLYHGVLVQLPLPLHWGEACAAQTFQKIDPAKDVDGFHPLNRGLLFLGEADLKPCTPMGVLSLLKIYKIPTAGRKVCLIGRSALVGAPLANLLSQKSDEKNNLGLGDATLTLCHSRSADLAEHTLQADILISAVGRPGLVRAGMVRENTAVIDVGTQRETDPARKRGYRLAGDVDYPEVFPRCGRITPVPGGVGPMTITWLLYNTITAACLQSGLEPFTFDWDRIRSEVIRQQKTDL